MKPILSVLMIVATLFLIVLVKMEIRRMGYELIHLKREYTADLEKYREHKLKLAKLLKPDYVREHAKSMLELDWAKSKQVIYLTGREDDAE